MKKTVIFIDHPHFDSSVVNRRWAEELRKYPDEFVVHNLESVYPRGVIDPAVEHSVIENNDALVFEFPLYWYNCPPMLKQWFDLVLTKDWAYGKAHRLEGRKVALAVSCGGSEKDYGGDKAKEGIESFLKPFIQSFSYCKADFRGTFAFFGAEDPAAATVENIAESARRYVEFIRVVAGTPEPKKD